VENTLFLLKLFKPGDLLVVHPCIETEDRKTHKQLPYRVMQYVHSTQMYHSEAEECEKFSAFAKEINSYKNFTSSWFQTARRFFLFGGTKEYGV